MSNNEDDTNRKRPRSATQSPLKVERGNNEQLGWVASSSSMQSSSFQTICSRETLVEFMCRNKELLPHHRDDECSAGNCDKNDSALPRELMALRDTLSIMLPLHLSLSWNISLNEAMWVQEFLGRSFLPPDALQLLLGDATKAASMKTSDIALSACSNLDAHSEHVFSWVKEHLATSGSSNRLNDPSKEQLVECGGGASTSSSDRGSGIHVSSAWEQLQNTQCVETGSLWLDKMLYGGLQCGFVTELVGRPCVGKSCLIANWVAAATVRGAWESYHAYQSQCNGPHVSLSGGVGRCIMINVGGNVSSRILQCLIRSHASQLALANPETLASRIDEQRLCHELESGAMERILVMNAIHTLSDLEAMMPLLKVSFRQQQHRKHRNMLVVDSFATLVHNSVSSESSESFARHQRIAHLMNLLKALAEDYNVTIVLVNHSITYKQRSSQQQAKDDDDDDDEEHCMLDDGEGEAADAKKIDGSSFGNTFFHAVNNRFVVGCIVHDGLCKRILRVVKSPVCPPVVFEIRSPTVSRQQCAAPPSVPGVSHDGLTTSLSPLHGECLLGDDSLQRCAWQHTSKMSGSGQSLVGVTSYLVPPRIL